MKNFKRIISIVCAIAMILTVCAVSVSADTTVTITMNNNGTITTQNLTPGSPMPSAAKNELSEKCLGWYTDPQNWTGKVDTVPNANTTVYAKYPSVVIDFNNLTTDSFAAGDNLSSPQFVTFSGITDGILTLASTGDWSTVLTGFKVPAYDVNWSASEFKAYQLKPSTAYTVTVRYKGGLINNSTADTQKATNLYALGTCSVGDSCNSATSLKGLNAWGTSYSTATVEFTTSETTPGELFYHFMRKTTFDVDKITITDKALAEEAAKPDFYIGWASKRVKTNEVNTGLRFRGRVGNDLGATDLGFIVCPTRLLTDAKTELVLESTNEAVVSLPVAGVYEAGGDYNDYQLCITNLMGEERGDSTLRDMTTDEFSVVMYAKTSEGTVYTEVKAATFSTLS